MEDKFKKHIPQFWGICDICAVTWYIISQILHHQIPLYTDWIRFSQINRSFGDPSLIIGWFIGAILYLSLIFSGFVLLKKKVFGAVISYIQTPFRLFLVIPPSIFFIIWPASIFNDKIIRYILGIIFILISESLKLWTVISWHKSMLRQKAIS